MSHLFRSIWYDIRINTAVMLGVMCAAAVLTGALLVGDSMRGSLKALTLQRLGSIDTILFAPNFIDFKTADGRRQTAEEAVILLPAVVEFNGRISGIQLLGRADTVCSINQTLADKLQIKAGGELSLRFLSPQSIPPESTFGKHDNLLRTKITVDKIIADEGVGRFSLKVDQQAEPLLIVPLEFMQSKLGVGKKVNAVFFMTDSPQTLLTAGQREALEKHFEPTLEDLGIDVEEHGGKWYIKSARMLFTNAQAEAIFRHSREGGNLDERLSSLAPRLRGGDDSRGRNVFHAGLLYLATSIRAVKNGREVPYSTVYATDFFTQRHEGTEEDNLCASVPPCEKKIALNQWTAEDLGVEVGDEIELTWFEPDNVNVTKSQTFTIKSIVPNELYPNEVVPIVKGFTDEKSIADWDPPFPFDAKKIRKKDEDYWDKYRAAPKAVVPLAVGQKLWGSRFGNVTTFVANRHPRASGELDEGLFSLGSRLRGNDKGSGNDGFLSLFGLNFIPVKEQGLAASAGTTPFSVLFLAFSFFIIASALMLVMLLFRLSVEMKAKQIGIFLACGWTPRQVQRHMLAQGFLISTAGSFFGVLFGILYAQLMIYGLTTWWVDAVTVPFLQLHINPMSLVIGFISGVVLSVLTILWSVRGVTKVPLRTLLHGVVERQQKETADGRRQTAADTKESQRAGDNEQCNPHMGCRKIFNRIMLFFFLFVFLLVLEPHPIKFFLVGALLLLLGTRAVSKRFTVSSRTDNTIDSLVKFASSNAVRNRSRSLLCIALIASTTFLVLSISAFYLDSGMRGRHGESNHGGYYYIGETMFPVFIDIGTPEGRAQLGIQPGDEAYLEEKRHVYDSTREAEYYIKERIVSLRVQGGDSVSCLNLYQSGTPRVLGIPKSTFEEITYQFFSSERRSQADNKYKPEKSVWSPIWQPITIDPDGVRRVPVIIDKNTAMYSLHLYGGVGDVYELDIGQGEKVRCEIVGLLYNSVLQGEIMMGEENFLTLFPEVGGYQYFLFRRGMYADSKIDNRTLKIYYDLLGDYGFQGEPTADRLRKLFAVQNTYLSTFQSLGGIGLLLGIFGLAVIQVRNVFERRKELALLQAIGFTKSRTILLLLYESFTLLAWGLGLAVLASAFALLPFLLGGVEQISPLSVLRQFIVLVGSLLAVGVVSNIAAAMSVLKIHAAAELAEER